MSSLHTRNHCKSKQLAMAPVYAISLVLPCGSVVADWTTVHRYTRLEVLRKYVPESFERGTYRISFAGEDIIEIQNQNSMPFLDKVILQLSD